MSLTFKLACRNLLHDRLRFVATVIGIVFSIVLVAIQMGLFVSFERMVTTMVDHASADLWVVPVGTKSFEDPSFLGAGDQHRAQAIPGVATAVPVVGGFSQWAVPAGGRAAIFVIGSDMSAAGLRPWHLRAGKLADLTAPDAVAVDRSYFHRLGIAALGDSGEIRGRKAQVKVVTSGIRSFTTTPYVFTTIERARAYTATPPDKISYLMLRLSPGADRGNIRRQLQASLRNTEVLTPAAFRRRSRDFWLYGTGAGAALFAGALLGTIVGTVIVAQTLYSSTKDHLNEFATLRAIGSSSRYILTVIVDQALISAVIGFSLAACIGLAIVRLTAASALPVAMPPQLTLLLFLLTVVMCIASAAAAIVQVVRIDPARVFKP